MREHYMGVYVSTEAGWDKIVQPLIKFVVDNGGTVDQIKEKFGGLRFYYSKPNSMYEEYSEEQEKLWEAFEETVSAAEEESYRTCEFTGNPGKPMNKGGFGWIKTVSAEIAEEQGYTKEVKLFRSPEEIKALLDEKE